VIRGGWVVIQGGSVVITKRSTLCHITVVLNNKLISPSQKPKLNKLLQQMTITIVQNPKPFLFKLVY